MRECDNITKETVEELTIAINRLRTVLQDHSNISTSMEANNDDAFMRSRKATEIIETLNGLTNVICVNTEALNRHSELMENYMQLIHEQREQEARTECEQEAQTKSGDFEWPEIL